MKCMRICVMLGVLLLAGCSTKRTLTIDTEPKGARVWVNDRYVGESPVAVPFVHYGEFEVRLEKAGHHPWAGIIRVPTQIDGYPVIDLPQELTVRQRAFRYLGRLEPLRGKATEADAAAALERARAFRERTLREVAEPGTPGRMSR
jgi:hypothetical protein